MFETLRGPHAEGDVLIPLHTPYAGTTRNPRNSSGRGRGDPHRVGSLTEIEVVAALNRAGYTVSVPLGSIARYDCVIEDRATGALRKVQVKTGYDAHGAVHWECRSKTWRRNESRSYVGEVDAFAVWVPERRALYLVPVSDCARLRGSLRLTRAKNGQEQGIRYAHQYLVED